LLLTELASHNDDIDRLLKKGYALRLDGAHLVVRDIPYLDASLKLQVAAIAAKLVFVDRIRVKQDDHQVYFSGHAPYGIDGQLIPNLGGGTTTLPLTKTDVIVQRSFSNKPSSGSFQDFFEKIESYVTVISGPAIELHGANPLTFRADKEEIGKSVFKFQDTLTSRAAIGDLTARFTDEVIAVIGLGGTGSYLLDFLVKLAVREIRAFDGDYYHVHNAYRSPGRLQEGELDKTKAEVFADRYDNFREGLNIRKKYIDETSAEDFANVTFVFVCVDKGTARAKIFDLLIALGIPFIDVGMGLNRKQDALSGTLRVTNFSREHAAEMRTQGLAETSDDPNDIYRSNIQIPELNALNACLAIIRYKQIRGFYVDDNNSHHLLFDVGGIKTFLESKS
jgi:hypothetical protein